MLEAVQGYLSELTPNRVLLLFVIALVAGSTVLVANVGGPFVVAVGTGAIVFAYGIVLFYSQTYLFVGLRPPVKNSPYILGFILTLVAFFNIFFKAEWSVVTRGIDIDPSLLVGQVGGALLSTIVGLGMRQVIVISDPQEKVLSEVYDEIAEQIRTHWSEFSDAQKGFVGLIKEFLGTKEKLFSQETEAFKRYVTNLQDLSTTLARFEKQHSAHWEKITNQMAQSLKKVHEQASESLTQSQQIRTGIQDSVKKFQQLIEQNTSALERQVQSLDNWNQRVERITKDTSQSVDALSHTVKAVNSHFTELGQKSKALVTDFDQFKDRFVGTLSNLSSSTRNVSDQTTHWMKETAKDLQAIDSILDEVAEVLKDKLEKIHR
ncbi:hypothetical protein MYX82_11835 [Acidobacteria bacterium AH-259-D05]|nr:hypothetical protein [Acidobacteria bacterium AH-259-D05]